jgi:phosphatidylinositol alpha-1,6-mannosyltransferase
MPSRQDLERHDVEGFGIVYIEASACGKPVVAGCTGGAPEAVLDGETGLLVDPEDPKAISDALIRILVDSDLATRLGKRGRERAEREFAWSVVAARVDSIVESMVSGR